MVRRLPFSISACSGASPRSPLRSSIGSATWSGLFERAITRLDGFSRSTGGPLSGARTHQPMPVRAARAWHTRPCYEPQLRRGGCASPHTPDTCGVHRPAAAGAPMAPPHHKCVCGCARVSVRVARDSMHISVRLPLSSGMHMRVAPRRGRRRCCRQCLLCRRRARCVRASAHPHTHAHTQSLPTSKLCPALASHMGSPHYTSACESTSEIRWEKPPDINMGNGSCHGRRSHCIRGSDRRRLHGRRRRRRQCGGRRGVGLFLNCAVAHVRQVVKCQPYAVAGRMDPPFEQLQTKFCRTEHRRSCSTNITQHPI